MKNTKEYRRQYNKANPAKILLYAARQRAKRNNLPFNLIEQDIRIPIYCPVFGIKLESQCGKGKLCDLSPSIDRINPRLGYIKENIVVVSHLANRLKSDATPSILRRIAEFYLSLCPPASLVYKPIQPNEPISGTLLA